MNPHLPDLTFIEQPEQYLPGQPLGRLKLIGLASSLKGQKAVAMNTDGPLKAVADYLQAAGFTVLRLHRNHPK